MKEWIYLLILLSIFTQTFGAACDFTGQCLSTGKDICSNQDTYCHMCSSDHCNAAQDTIRETCKINDWGANICMVTKIPSTSFCCVCRCSCFVYDTPVLMGNDTFAPIQNIKLKDSVKSLDKDVWISKEVIFSQGTKPGKNNTVLYIEVENGDYVICEEAQVFLIEDTNIATKDNRRLVRAGALNPLKHTLVKADFTTTPIKRIILGESTKGVWHISLDEKDPIESHHLINVNGIIAGDFYLELTKIENKTVENLPLFGSPGHPSFVLDDTNVPKIDSFTPFIPKNFNSLHEDETVQFAIGNHIGTTDHKAFLKKLSEPDSDIPEYNEELNIQANQLIALFQMNYPSITFNLEFLDPRVEIISKLNKNKKEITIFGGTFRSKTLGWKGGSLLIAVEIGRFVGGEPHVKPNDSLSFTCPDKANWVASVAVLRKMFDTGVGGPVQNYMDIVVPAIDHVINYYDKHGPPKIKHNECKLSSKVRTRCYKETWLNGIGLLPIPKCWHEDDVLKEEL